MKELLAILLSTTCLVASGQQTPEQEMEAPPVALLPDEKACLIFEVWQQQTGYRPVWQVIARIHGPSLTTFYGASGHEIRLIEHLQKKKIPPSLRVRCAIQGVPHELGGDVVRRFIESDLRVELKKEVQASMSSLLTELKKLNADQQAALIDKVQKSILESPSFQDAVNEAVKATKKTDVPQP